MRLINAESPQNRMYVSDLVIEEMKKIPTVDIDRPTRSQFKRMAVQLGYEPVVHCKYCRLGEPDMIFNGYKDEIWCNYYEHPKPAYGFCEKGKRRTNENEPDGTRALENGSVDSLPVVR